MNRKQRRADAKTNQPEPFKDSRPGQDLFAEAVLYHQSGRLADAERLYRQILRDQPLHAAALHLLGVLARQVGHSDLAVDLIGKAIAQSDQVPAYHSNLGNALQGQGNRAASMTSYRRALILKPDYADALSNLGLAFQEIGQLEKSAVCYGWALVVNPNIAEVHSNLGITLKQLGKPVAAVASYRRALTHRPDHAEARSNLGIALQALGRQQEAISSYRFAQILKPAYAEVHYNVGIVLTELDKSDEAIASYGRAVLCNPTYVEALSNLGSLLKEQGKLEQAAACFERALGCRTDYAEVHSNFGIVLREQGKIDAAVVSYRRALIHKPDYAEAYNNLGGARKEQGKLESTVTAFRRAIVCRPGFAEAHNNLGNVFQDQSKLDEAVACYDRALTHKPDFASARSNLMMCLHYRTGIEGSALLAEARRFGVWAESAAPATKLSNAPDGARRLRIGYVSGDFAQHPVGYFLSAVLACHDRSAVEIFCYSNRPRTDAMTARLRGDADHWRNLVGVTDEKAAATIAADGIDILVDLSGHTAHNRLPLFARKAAPVQISWMGFWGTTGLSMMDYILSDSTTIPPGEEGWYSEKVLHLPGGRFCYAPPDYAPSPAPPPSLSKGWVTFGSFNNLTKVGPDVVRLWAAVLQAIPGSRLLLKWKSLADEQMRSVLIGAFNAEGIEAERLELRGESVHGAMLAEYGDIDIALDPFPFSGGLTSCEALWMGVPVVTLPSGTAPSRQTLGFLRALSLTDWVAASVADYVRIAVKLAGDREGLAELRCGLRARMAASSLCDGPAFTKGLEAVFRKIWQNWCGQADDAGDTEPLQRKISAGHELSADHLHVLGINATQAGDHARAAALIRRAIAISPQIDAYSLNLGVVLKEQGQMKDAIATTRRALAIRGDAHEGHNNLGTMLQAQGRLQRAAVAYMKAVSVKPDYADAPYNLGIALKDLGWFEQAVICFGRALRLQPGYPGADNFLGIALQNQGRLEEAEQAFERGIASHPEDRWAASNLVFLHLYKTGFDLPAIAQAVRDWNLAYAEPFRGEWPVGQRPRQSGQRPRIGFVSGDFRTHAVGFLVLPVIEGLRRAGWHLSLYANNSMGDAVTERFRAAANLWRDVLPLSDDALAAQIVADGIDILVDLSGHSAGNRLLVFARKPAPIQMTWLGFPASTGLSAMDYILADRHQIPPEAERHYTEKVVRLPESYVAFAKPDDSMVLGELPAIGRGLVTFGSFNALKKVTPQVVATWSRILKRLPNARLLMKTPALNCEGTRFRYGRMFATHGIDADRLTFMGGSTPSEHRAAMAGTDIALDSFPYSGGQTTLECLWMGLPVITLPGETFASRHSFGYLSTVGLQDLAVADIDRYVEHAVELAGDLQYLAALRAGMRRRISDSSLCDIDGFVGNLGRAFDAVWRGIT